MIRKACPVLLRGAGRATEILAFRHPLAGTQIVKGTIEPGESVEEAAIREMREESGLIVTVDRPLGRLLFEETSQIWHVLLCRSPLCPDSWRHRTEDDGGHVFTFFWHPLNRPADDAWHPDFVRVLGFVADRIIRRS